MPLSRGHGIRFLIQDEEPESYVRNVANNGKKYNGFNLIVGDTDALWYCSNYRDGIERLSSGFYGLSNHLWKHLGRKCRGGKEKMKAILRNSAIDPEMVFEILYDDQVAADSLLPDTGLTLERERALSSMFIKTEGYGSRCSTVILIDKNNDVLFSRTCL
jgi:uncharacterized protein with NRDE domain